MGAKAQRAALANPSKYLLTNLALCGDCGSPLQVISSRSGATRRHYYGCSGHRERGICDNRRWLPMADGNDIVIEALLDDVLDEDIVRNAVDRTFSRVRSGDRHAAGSEKIERELATLTREHARLLAAIGAGEQVAGLLEALRALDRRRKDLEARRAAMGVPQGLSARESGHVREELLDLAGNGRQILAGEDQGKARPIVSALLIGRATFAPLDERHRWRVTGEGSLDGLFERVCAVGYTSPTGTARGCGPYFRRIVKAA